MLRHASNCSLESTHSVLIFKQALIVTRKSNHEKKTLDAFKTMYPFLAFRSLSTNIHHPEIELSQFEQCFRNTSRPKSRMKHILIVRQPAGGEKTIDRVEKTAAVSKELHLFILAGCSILMEVIVQCKLVAARNRLLYSLVLP